ncbi:MAG: hypothetical protein K2N64_06120 [Anaeroplasmataceae bacterium]|nr:hypothetical protein [Anaeroplasmataceae bacterium]
MLFLDVIANPLNQFSTLVIGIVFLVIALVLLGAGIFLLIQYLRNRNKK